MTVSGEEIEAISTHDPAMTPQGPGRGAGRQGALPGLVDRRDRLSVNQFKHEYLLRNRPVVIVDAVEDWPARKTWTFDYFRDRYGHLSTTVYRYDPDNEFTPGDVAQMRLGDTSTKLSPRDRFRITCAMTR